MATYSVVYDDYHVILLRSQEDVMRLINGIGYPGVNLMIGDRSGEPAPATATRLRELLTPTKVPRNPTAYVYQEGSSDWVMKVTRHR